MQTAYIYKWTHIPTLKWYVGARYGKDAHPNDNYICSSVYVKPLIQQNPNQWQKIIVDIGTPDEMLLLESNILQAADAKNDPRSLNQHNGDSKFRLKFRTEESKIKQSQSTKGRSNIWAKGKASWNKGLKGYYFHSEKTKKYNSERQRGEKNHMFGRKGILNPNFGKKLDGTRVKEIRKDKYWSAYRCSCILCHKEVSNGTLENHIGSRFCLGYTRPKMSCVKCQKEIWASSRHNHFRLSKCKIDQKMAI